jgi:hypothetical protein
MSHATCPICGSELRGHIREWPDYPFCSVKCRKIDLGRWLGESYAIPADEPPHYAPEENGRDEARESR